MKTFAADLHIHTALSPCALTEMTPVAIVQAAIGEGLDMIAICDHNSAGNVRATQEAARGDTAVLAGIEITTSEEAHVIGLFPDATAACAVGDAVRATLPEQREASRTFGEQLLMNASGEVLGAETKILSTASGFALRDAVKLIKKHHGLAIAAHIDRPSFSIVTQLGVFPAESDLDAIEISAAAATACRAGEFMSFGLPVMASSDSHFLSDVGSCATVFEMLSAAFDELTLALRGAAGRSLHCA